MVRIYIASPYTNGDKLENVNLQIDVAEVLMKKGYAPYVPLLTHFQVLKYSHPEEVWMALESSFLEVCDILIRIKPIKDGKEVPSPGADKEEATARSLGIPVFTFNSKEELVLFLEDNEFFEEDEETIIHHIKE